MSDGNTTTLARIAPETSLARIAVGGTFIILIMLCGSFTLLCAGVEVTAQFAVQPVVALFASFFALLFGAPYLMIILWLDRNENCLLYTSDAADE